MSREQRAKELKNRKRTIGSSGPINQVYGTGSISPQQFQKTYRAKRRPESFDPDGPELKKTNPLLPTAGAGLSGAAVGAGLGSLVKRPRIGAAVGGALGGALGYASGRRNNRQIKNINEGNYSLRDEATLSQLGRSAPEGATLENPGSIQLPAYSMEDGHGLKTGAAAVGAATLLGALRSPKTGLGIAGAGGAALLGTALYNRKGGAGSKRRAYNVQAYQQRTGTTPETKKKIDKHMLSRVRT